MFVLPFTVVRVGGRCDGTLIDDGRGCLIPHFIIHHSLLFLSFQLFFFNPSALLNTSSSDRSLTQHFPKEQEMGYDSAPSILKVYGCQVITTVSLQLHSLFRCQQSRIARMEDSMASTYSGCVENNRGQPRAHLWPITR